MKKGSPHPARGRSFKVEPIRLTKDIRRVKKLLEDNLRDHCLFTFGINSAYRANELLSIRVGDVDYLRPDERFELKQSKTKKHRAVKLNVEIIDAIDRWLAVHPNPSRNAPLFPSQKGGGALTVNAVSLMVKKWCRDAGLRGNYASHTLRKTWAYQQRMKRGCDIGVLMTALGHSSQEQTLEYICVQPQEVEDLYLLRL